VQNAFEFAVSFSKLARLALAGFQKWWALCGLFFKREHGSWETHLFARFQNWQNCPLASF
jgi:hypothetical protein